MASRRAVQHQKQREDLAEATAKAVLNEWRNVDPAHVARHWARLLPRVTAMVQAGQLTAANQTPAYMRELLRDDDDGPSIVPEQFASQAPDGRDLNRTLALPIPRVLRGIARGLSPQRAKAAGTALLDMLVRTVVSDTGRQADRVAMFANRRVTSYIRVVEMPACARCIILAGREYSVSTGFLRHPNCDCTMEPVTRRYTPEHRTPEQLFTQMSNAERHRAFGDAGSQAIEHGARISSVVNARKGMHEVEMHGQRVQVTHAGTGRGRRKRPPRLMPEEIFKQADSQNHAIQLLFKNGYLR